MDRDLTARLGISQSLIDATLNNAFGQRQVSVIYNPLTILSTLPSAGVGAILALLAFQTEFSIIAMIGVILPPCWRRYLLHPEPVTEQNCVVL